MTFLWSIAALAVLVAGFALASARRAAATAARLAESYWELRYEYGQLASRLERVEAQLAGRPILDDPLTTTAASPAARDTKTSFVPLSSLKSSSAEEVASPKR